jgi:hypothetical protein
MPRKLAYNAYLMKRKDNKIDSSAHDPINKFSFREELQLCAGEPVCLLSLLTSKSLRQEHSLG